MRNSLNPDYVDLKLENYRVEESSEILNFLSKVMFKEEENFSQMSNKIFQCGEKIKEHFDELTELDQELGQLFRYYHSLIYHIKLSKSTDGRNAQISRNMISSCISKGLIQKSVDNLLNKLNDKQRLFQEADLGLSSARDLQNDLKTAERSIERLGEIS